MTDRITSAEIEQQAAQWAARADACALDPQADAELQSWLASDTRCVGAYAMALAALARVADAIGSLDMPQEPETGTASTLSNQSA